MSVVSLEAARSYLDALDLQYLIQKMCAPDYFLPRWTLADATHCAQLYKNFLFLHKKYAPTKLVPTREIDEFWHNHILYTRQYHHDCMHIFGHYLHHEPASPDEAPEKLVNDFMRTKALYLETFNEALTLIVPVADNACDHNGKAP